MANNVKPLTSVQEPGFFSEIQVSPSLFLTPGGEQVVGLVGTGKPTKTVASLGIRSSVSSDLLTSPVVSINLVSSDAVYTYPPSSYASAQRGTVDLSTIILGDLTGKVITATVDGKSADTWAFTVLASVADIAVQINAHFVNIKAEIDSAHKLVLYTNPSVASGLSFLVGSGNANLILGLTDGARAQSIRWDPAAESLGAQYAPQPGTDYTVNFETPKVAADFAPQSFFGLPQVVAQYGDASQGYSLSVGAAAAFATGASIVTCRQLSPAELTPGPALYGEMSNALSDMEVQSISILVPMVPLNDGSGCSPLYINHVSKMSSKLERMERMCILGMDETAGRLETLGTAPSWESYLAAFNSVTENSGLQSERVMVVNPGQATFSYKNADYTVDGTYLAASLAGLMVSPNYDVATPMTRKVMSNVLDLILPELARAEKNTLTSMGATVIEAANGNVQVRRAITCDSSSIPAQEPSIVRAFDLVAQDLRMGLENRFIGSKILPNSTARAVEAATSSFLEEEVAAEIIGAYRNVKAQQNPVEPRQFDVSFEAVPLYPFIWGFIDLSITLS